VIGAARRQARAAVASSSSSSAAAAASTPVEGGKGGKGGGKADSGSSSSSSGGSAGRKGEELQRKAAVAKGRAEIAKTTASQSRARMDAMERETRRKLLEENPDLREQHTQVGREGGREGGKRNWLMKRIRGTRGGSYLWTSKGEVRKINSPLPRSLPPSCRWSARG